ncbi:MAG: hypothetical protein AB1345_05575 [Chloroflexota bacterium]
MFLAQFLRLLGACAFLCLFLTRSALPPANKIEQVRAFTRDIEFGFVSWTLDALGLAVEQFALGTAKYLSPAENRQLVLDYLELIADIHRAEARVRDMYANPDIINPEIASALERGRLDRLYERRDYLEPLAESIIQAQLNVTLAELHLTLGGQPLPPVLYHTTPLPLGLIVSPRDIIRQDANISIDPNLTMEQSVALEERVDRALNVSTLVVELGGMGTYPTMILETSDINWLVEVVAHEWVHNFLTLRPLGMLYDKSPAMRTINETVASIAGKEIGYALLARFYPEFLPQPPWPPTEKQPYTTEPPEFDFLLEMHITRETVDEMLAEGQIRAAEEYMEQRRHFFWEHGYYIRKLNQAYFAFHGAYADLPGGAAGEDPVGAAVRDFRRLSPSLSYFLKQLSWITSFEQLQSTLQDDS